MLSQQPTSSSHIFTVLVSPYGVMHRKPTLFLTGWPFKHSMPAALFTLPHFSRWKDSQSVNNSHQTNHVPPDMFLKGGLGLYNGYQGTQPCSSFISIIWLSEIHRKEMVTYWYVAKFCSYSYSWSISLYYWRIYNNGKMGKSIMSHLCNDTVLYNHKHYLFEE